MRHPDLSGVHDEPNIEYELTGQLLSERTRVLEHRTASGATLRAHTDAIPNLQVAHVCFLAQGCIEERRGSERIVRVAPHLRASPAGDSHSVHCGPSHARCLYIAVDSLSEDGDSRWIDRPVFSKVPAGISAAQRLHAHLREGFVVSNGDVELLATELLAALLVPGACVAPKGPPAWLWRVRDMLEEPGAGHATFSEMACEAGVHRVHLARTFHACFGQSLSEYRRKSRLRRARALLAGTRTPVSRIAVEAGYYDQSHLTREFGEAFHVTPAAFRSARC